LIKEVDYSEMRTISTVNSHALAPIIDSLLRDRDFAEHVYSHVGLPPGLLDIDDCAIPQVAIWRLGAYLTQYSNNPHFTWDCVSAYQKPIANSPSREPTQLKAITNYIATLDRATPEVCFGCYATGDKLWLVRRPLLAPNENEWPAESYAIAVYVRFVQRLLSTDCFPSRIHLRSDVPQQSMPPQWHDSEIKICQTFTAVAFPLELFLPRGATDIGTLLDGQPPALMPSSLTAQQDQARNIVRTFVLAGTTQISGPAAALGMSVRTFQRKLKALDLNYKVLVSHSRLDRARELLADSDLAVSDIAFELGYKHPGDFTRAFTRKNSMPPRAYREEAQSRTDVFLAPSAPHTFSPPD
jgi:AraC-like DNA-binding protein